MFMHDHRLCIESGDGSPAREYRVMNGSVQGRTLAADDAKSVWRTLTPFNLRGPRRAECSAGPMAQASHRLETSVIGLCGLEDRSAESRSESYHAV
jgi:hypothetical protein